MHTQMYSIYTCTHIDTHIDAYIDAHTQRTPNTSMYNSSKQLHKYTLGVHDTLMKTFQWILNINIWAWKILDLNYANNVMTSIGTKNTSLKMCSLKYCIVLPVTSADCRNHTVLLKYLQLCVVYVN